MFYRGPNKGSIGVLIDVIIGVLARVLTKGSNKSSLEGSNKGSTLESILTYVESIWSFYTTFIMFKRNLKTFGMNPGIFPKWRKKVVSRRLFSRAWPKR